MIVRYARSALPVGLAVACLLAAAAPASAGERADRVQSWLAGIAASAATSGHRLSWGEVSTSLFGGDVTVRQVRAVDARGAEHIAIAALTVEEPQANRVAGSVHMDDVRLTGAYAGSVRIGRLDLGRTDLRALGEALASLLRQDGKATATAWGRLGADRVGIRNLQADAVGTAGPVHFELARADLDGVGAGGYARLELDGLRLTGTGDAGDRVTLSLAELRAEDVAAGAAIDAISGDPLQMRPLSAFADLRIGKLEVKGFRTESSLTGVSEIDRQQFSTRIYTPGRAGILRFASEGVRSRSNAAPGPLSPLRSMLFPPDGNVAMTWTGDIAYDLSSGFLGYRQETAIDDFGSFSLQADVSGVPDLTVAEWQAVAKGDPRLEALQINGLSLALTDAGGIDRAVLALSADKRIPADQLRGAVAEQIAEFARSMAPRADARLLRWLAVVQDFVRLGGTLAVGVTRPIPIGGVGGQPVKIGDLGDLAERYGLAVVRR